MSGLLIRFEVISQNRPILRRHGEMQRAGGPFISNIRCTGHLKMSFYV